MHLYVLIFNNNPCKHIYLVLNITSYNVTVGIYILLYYIRKCTSHTIVIKGVNSIQKF